MRFLIFIAVAGVFLSESVVAQVSVNVPGYSVQVDNGSGKTAGGDAGAVDSDVQIEGITIINDKLFIDGIEVKRGKTVYTSPKSKKIYKIQWGKGGNISVAEK